MHAADKKSLRQKPDLPKNWKKTHKNAFLHAISLAHAALTCVISRAWNSTNPILRDQARLQRLQMELYFERECNRLLRMRLSRIPPAKRPRYSPEERMDILRLKAAQFLSLSKAAAVFVIDKQTVFNWTNSLRNGDELLLRLPVPVNRFPDFIRASVRHLKPACPDLGIRKLAEILSRTGVHIAETTLRRFCKEKNHDNPNNGFVVSNNLESTPATDKGKSRIVTAKYPDHLWHADLTLLPTGKGLWVPWFPFALTQRWPFCWWLLVIEDHFSRRIHKIGLWKKQPTSGQVCRVLDQAVKSARKKPKYIVTDKGAQFWHKNNETFFQRWCRRRKVRPRFGAIGKHGSIAVVEPEPMDGRRSRAKRVRRTRSRRRSATMYPHDQTGHAWHCRIIC